MRVKTKDRNWLGELFNGGDEYADLGDHVPDLFDEFGNVTLEGLQKLRESDEWDKLGEKDRALIDQMINDWEDYNAAVEATNKYLSDVFGDLGYTMTNALVDAFENGTDAAQAFGEAASDVIEKLATDMIHAALVQLDWGDESRGACRKGRGRCHSSTSKAGCRRCGYYWGIWWQQFIFCNI